MPKLHSARGIVELARAQFVKAAADLSSMGSYFQLKERVERGNMCEAEVVIGS
jgi:hypothetical protein